MDVERLRILEMISDLWLRHHGIFYKGNQIVFLREAYRQIQFMNVGDYVVGFS